MIKKFKKRSLLETYTFKGYLEGPIFAYGRTGAGKSVSLLSICQSYHDLFNYKIWDLYGGERKEHLFWSIPSQENEYWNKIKLIGQLDEEGPKQYKVTYLYPYFGRKLPNKLPVKSPVVISKVFTIPIKDITIEDVATVIGIPSETTKFCFQELQQLLKKNDNSGGLLEICKKIKGIANTPLYKNFLVPLHREKLLMDKNCNFNLDLQDEAKDTESVSVLCLDFVPHQFHTFIINYICRRLCDLLDVNKIPKKNIFFMREAATFFKATDDSIMEDRLKIFRANMANYIRMGRRGFYACLDSQSASETKGLVEGSSDFLLIFNTTSWRDKQEMTEELKREKRMRIDQIGSLAFLEKGEAYIAESRRNVVKVQIRLPRTMFWKKEYGNFYKNIWPRFGGSWINLGEITDYIDDRCEENYVLRKVIDKKDKSKIPDIPVESQVVSIPLVPEVNKVVIPTQPVRRKRSVL